MQELTLTTPQTIIFLIIMIGLTIKLIRKENVIEIKVPEPKKKEWEWHGAYLQNAYKKSN